MLHPSVCWAFQIIRGKYEVSLLGTALLDGGNSCLRSCFTNFRVGGSRYTVHQQTFDMLACDQCRRYNHAKAPL